MASLIRPGMLKPGLEGFRSLSGFLAIILGSKKTATTIATIKRISVTPDNVVLLRVDGSVKSPISSLSGILLHCGVRKVRLIPQDLHALILNILRNRLNLDFLQDHQGSHENKFADMSPFYSWFMNRPVSKKAPCFQSNKTILTFNRIILTSFHPPGLWVSPPTGSGRRTFSLILSQYLLAT
jgi:hypothetical protein